MSTITEREFSFLFPDPRAILPRLLFADFQNSFLNRDEGTRRLQDSLVTISGMSFALDEDSSCFGEFYMVAADVVNEKQTNRFPTWNNDPRLASGNGSDIAQCLTAFRLLLGGIVCEIYDSPSQKCMGSFPVL